MVQETTSTKNETSGFKYLRTKLENYILDENKNPKIHITIFISFLSFCLYFFDIVSDLIVACLYFHKGQILYGSLVLIFFYLPTILIFVLEWRVRRRYTMKDYIICVLNLDGIKAFIDLFKKLKEKWFNPDRDINFVEEKIIIKVMKTVEAFLESFPQMILQMYLLSLAIDAGEEVTGFKYVSIYSSIVGFIITLTGTLGIPANAFLSDKSILETVIVYIWLIFDSHFILFTNLTIILSIMTNFAYILCVALFLAYIQFAIMFYNLRDFFKKIHSSYFVFSILAFVVVTMCSSYHLTQYKDQHVRRCLSKVIYLIIMMSVTVLWWCVCTNVLFYWPLIYGVVWTIATSGCVAGACLAIAVVMAIILDLDVVDYDRYKLKVIN